MVVNQSFVWVQQGTAACKRGVKGDGATFWKQNKTRVSFEECMGDVAA